MRHRARRVLVVRLLLAGAACRGGRTPSGGGTPAAASTAMSSADSTAMVNNPDSVAWARPDSTWTTVRSARLGLEFRVPPATALRLRGPARAVCADSVPDYSKARFPVVEGDTTADIPVLHVYFTRAPFWKIADRAGFDSSPPPPQQGWWLSADQLPGQATLLGDGRTWRGLEATGTGHFGIWEPERRRQTAADSENLEDTGVFDLHVAVAAFTRADGCQVVIEVTDPDLHLWRAVLGTVRLR